MGSDRRGAAGMTKEAQIEITEYVKRGMDAEAILKKAANPKSALHSLLEWDDSAAAHAWRLRQIGRLICSVRIESRDASSRVSEVRLCPGPRGENGNYLTASQVGRSKSAMSELADLARRDLRTFRRRYALLTDVTLFARLFALIDAVCGREEIAAE